MTSYEQLVTRSQLNFERYQAIYASGGVPYELAEPSPFTYEQRVERLAHEVAEADCVLVGGASGLSAAGGGDFYYGDTPSFREHFGKFAEKYGIRGAFDGSFRRWETPEEKWAYLSTFLYTTQTAPVRAPYRDLDALLAGKDFFVVTSNQDTQFVKLYPEDKVAQIQGDHRFFQCARCCTDDTWDAVEPVRQMIEAQGDDTRIPTELIPRCPHCGGEAFPWVRGYGNFLQGARYEGEYEKASRWVEEHVDRKMLLLELGVGRLTPMFIQEPFWNLALALPHARYVAVNDRYDLLPAQIADRGMVIVADIARVLADARRELSAGGEALPGACDVA